MKKLIKPLSLVLFGSVMAYAGFLVASYLTVYIEANDRLKYEAAYANGYFKVLKAIESGEVEKAKKMLSWYVDSHFVTLSEYRYLENSLLKDDIDKYLCNVAKYKLDKNIEVKNPELVEQVLELAKEIKENGC